MFAPYFLLEDTNDAVVLDNESVYNVCWRNFDIERLVYTNLNRLVAKIISSLTASLIFDDACNVDATEFQTNLLTYLHFMVSALVISAEKAYHEQLTVSWILNSALELTAMMAKCVSRNS